MRNLDKPSFIAQINTLKETKSVQGKIYHSIRADGHVVQFIRGGKSKSERINLDELFELYQAVDCPNTKEARSYISGRVQSPAVSIIKALSQSEHKTDSHEQNNLTDKVLSEDKKRARKSANKDQPKDETRFFQAFAEVVNERYLLSKSIYKPVKSNHAFLSDDFRSYAFPEQIDQNFEQFLAELDSNIAFSGKSIAHFIDGLLVDHPQFGTRIVEFDEEQHFSPSLFYLLSTQSQRIKLDFSAYYLSLLQNTSYLNEEVLKKNRIKYRFSEYPQSHKDFLEAIQNERESGYIKPKQNGFPYLGGRIAQRAYYDSLRNAAHLSPKNTGFAPVLRFPKKYFEDKCGKRFSSLHSDQLKDVIKKCLIDIYKQEI